MARSRTLRPGFFTDYTLAKVNRDARLFYAGLWVEADDQGRLLDSPKMLAGAIFPHDDDVTPKKVVQWIDDLVRIGRVERYDVAGDPYLWIPKFGEHQKPPHPTPSKLPPPPSQLFRESSVSGTREERGSITGNAALVSVSVPVLVPVYDPARPDGREKGGTGAYAPGEDTPRLVAARRIAAVCRARQRARVSLEAAELISWCWDVVDGRIIDEAIGWFEQAERPPDYPPAVASLIRMKANDHGIRIGEFLPTRARSA